MGPSTPTILGLDTATRVLGYGAGQLFLIGPAGTTAYAILFFGIQVLFCGWWLNRFRFGPLEWLWRSLTYGKAQPFRIAR